MVSPVKLIRRRLLLTQAQFAEKIGVSRVMIYSYELGHKAPSNKMIKKLLELAKENGIECNAEDFFKDE